MNSNKERKRINKTRKVINRGRIVNQDILKVSIFFAILAFALIVYICIFLTFDASSVINNRYNKRAESFKKTVQRGTIYSSDGTALAYSDVDDGEEVRIYPYGRAFAHVVGFEANGGLGLESSYNYYLLTSHTNMLDKISNEFKGAKNPGDDMYTTLDLNLQLYISDLLDGMKASVICMDPSDGKIKAMVSKDDFDPNYIEENWEEIIADEENSPLVNRATQGQYPPGSTFKIFTLLEYMRENPDFNNFEYNCTSTIEKDNYSIACHDYTEHGWQNLKDSFANSCNCAFATIGTQLDLDRFYTNNSNLLFNSKIDIDIAYNPAAFNLTKEDSEFIIMQTAFGQGKTQTNPLQLSLVMSAIANDGVLMKPHLVTKVTSPSGETVKTFKDKVYLNLFEKEETNKLQEFLRSVVTDGTAQCLAWEDYTAYGKTGTAETLSDKNLNVDMSWFVGYAEKDGEKLVICLNIEDTSQTWEKAVDYSHYIFNYYFY